MYWNDDLFCSYCNPTYDLFCSYCDPTYAFPPQGEVIDFTVSLVLRELQRTPDTLIVCGSYTIGKERIFIGNGFPIIWACYLYFVM